MVFISLSSLHNIQVETISKLRADFSTGRIIFHHIGYGFPQLTADSIYLSGNIQISPKLLFILLTPPTLYIFDCDNAGSILPVFESIVKHCSEQRYKSLHVLTRGLKNIPKVDSDFDPEWFKQNVMIPMRSVLMKYPIVFTEDNGRLKKIEIMITKDNIIILLTFSLAQFLDSKKALNGQTEFGMKISIILLILKDY